MFRHIMVYKPGELAFRTHHFTRLYFTRYSPILQIKFEHHARAYSNPARRPNFFSQFVENIRQEIAKNKEMRESLKKFREEAEKLEHSEALQKARQKFQSVESEASKGTEVLKDKLGSLKDKVQEALEEASKSDIAKKAGQLTEELGKSARGAAETISEKSQKLGKTGAFQTVSETAKIVKKELDEGGMNARMYCPPEKLRKRVEVVESDEDRVISPNTEATGMELHKDSRVKHKTVEMEPLFKELVMYYEMPQFPMDDSPKIPNKDIVGMLFYQSWQNFKDNNPYVNKVLDWKIKYDESDNPVIRASRLLTDKVSDIMGGLFQKTEMSETLTEICKLDPSFDKNKFLVDCEKDIIPNILEAIVRGELEILRDWCYEAPYNTLATPIKQAKAAGLRLDSKVLDIDNVDLAMGKVMDQGPVLVITFTSQQILCARDTKNNIVDGDPEKVLRVHYVWVLCRDRSELDPRAAWKLLDLSANSTEQLV